MANRRTFSWSAALRDLRNERTRRASVREERLKAAASVRGAVHLSSWRGRSGRRYVVGIHPLGGTDGLDATDAVLIAVKRDEDGFAHLIDAMAAGPKPRDPKRTAWIAGAC